MHRHGGGHSYECPACGKPLTLGAIMTKPQQYDTFELAKDLNSVIRKGMQGVILEILSENIFEVEFVERDGTNLEFNGQKTFTIDANFIND